MPNLVAPGLGVSICAQKPLECVAEGYRQGMDGFGPFEIWKDFKCE